MTQIPDALQAAPNVYRQLMENNRVRVLDLRFKPGEKAAMHMHPDHVVYVLNDQKLRLTRSNGQKKDFDLKAGQVLWIDAESHATENLGKTETHSLVIELKDKK